MKNSFSFYHLSASVARPANSSSLAIKFRAPVPTGIRRPKITFSFRPNSLSTLPLVAAAIRTRVVSWNEAADKNESVDRLAL